MRKTVFVTGAEGCGKTSLIPFLKDELEGFRINDFDEVGVPDNPPLQWRLDTTKYWLKIANNNQKKGLDTLVAGLIFPCEVEKYEEHKSLDITFILLDISVEERKKRLIKRKADEELINEPERIGELRDDFKKTKFKNKIIDVTNKSLEQTAKEINELTTYK